MYIYVDMYTYIYICVYICVYIHAHTYMEKQVDVAAFVTIACDELQKMKVKAHLDSTPAPPAVCSSSI